MSDNQEFHSFYITHKRFFDAYRVNEQGALAFLRALTSDPNSTFFSVASLSSDLSSGVEGAEVMVKLEKRRLPYTVDAFQKATFMRAWGDVFDLEFTQSMKVGHPMPAGFRILESEVLLSLCDHSKPIVDVGGNCSYHVRHNRRHLHSCCPLLNIRDHSRMKGRLIEMGVTAKDVRSKSAKFAQDVLAKPSLAYCNKKSQSCDFKAKTLLWVHSIYDMKLSDLAIQMDSHDAQVGYGVFMYTDAVFDDNEGPLKEIDACFSKVNGRIRFFFNRDPSAAYDHDWNEYKKFLVDGMVGSKKHTYYYRVYPTNRNSMMFTVTRLDTSRMKASLSKDYVITRNRRSRVKVSVYDINWNRASDDRRFVTTRDVFVPTEFYHEVMSFCFAKMRDESIEDPLDFHAFVRHCRTANRYMDINGNPVSGIEKVEVKDFNVVAVSLFHLAAMIVAYRRVQTGMVLKDIQKHRALADQGFFGNFFRYCGTFLPNMHGFRNLVDDFKMVLLRRVDNDCFSVLVEEESRYRSIHSMTTAGSMSKVEVNFDHGLEKDLGADWNVSEEDVDVVIDVLRAQGDDAHADFLSSKRGKASKANSMSGSETLNGSVAPETASGDKNGEYQDDEEEDFFRDPDLEEDSEATTSEYRIEVSGRHHDPADRDMADVYRREAIDEYVRYCDKSFEKDVASARSQVRESWNWFNSTPNKTYCKRKMQTVEAPNYIKFDGRQMVESVLPLTVDGYMWGMEPDTANLVRIVGGVSQERGGILKAKYRGWLFVCSELTVLNSHLIADSIRTTIASLGGYGENPVVYLAEGIAGSGKSTRIRAAHQPADMIFTSTSASQKDMVAALQPGGKSAPKEMDYSPSYLKAHVVTNHSYLMNSTMQAQTIRCDESLLAHVGELYAVAMKCGARVVHWSGDAVQIPFLNRIDSLMKLERSTIQYFDHYEFWRKSYRLTHDAMKASNLRYYKGRGRTCNPVVQGMTFHKIADPSDPRIAEAMQKADLSMGFYKSERAELSKRVKGANAKTVHEAQGEDHERTVLVRFNDRDNGGLYSGPSKGGNGHTFVGCTRNSKELTIFHRGPVDEICEFFNAGSLPMPVDDYVFDADKHKDRFVYF